MRSSSNNQTNMDVINVYRDCNCIYIKKQGPEQQYAYVCAHDIVNFVTRRNRRHKIILDDLVAHFCESASLYAVLRGDGTYRMSLGCDKLFEATRILNHMATHTKTLTHTEVTRVLEALKKSHAIQHSDSNSKRVATPKAPRKRTRSRASIKPKFIKALEFSSDGSDGSDSSDLIELFDSDDIDPLNDYELGALDADFGSDADYASVESNDNDVVMMDRSEFMTYADLQLKALSAIADARAVVDPAKIRTVAKMDVALANQFRVVAQFTPISTNVRKRVKVPQLPERNGEVMYTVRDRIRHLGYNLRDFNISAVGKDASKLYQKRYNTYPLKEDRCPDKADIPDFNVYSDTSALHTVDTAIQEHFRNIVIIE